MSKENNVVEEHEGLIYQTYPCAYYVQSPSTLSHANSADIRTNIQNDTQFTFHSHEEDASRFALCGYSASSRGSSHSFSHHKKISYDATTTENGDVNHLVIIDNGDDNEKEEEEGLFYDERKGGWMRRYFSYGNSDSCGWIWLQMSWRILVSFGVALLVFYIATKPPPPNLSIQIARIREFKLGEGVDRSGVTTKMLSCNSSTNLMIENKSRFFGLHIHPPIMDMKFSILPFAFSHGAELYAESGLTIFELEIGTKNKPMYGAGRSMQDLLDSGNGLPIMIQVRVTSYFKVFPILIKPTFHHKVQCMLLINNSYNIKHRSQAFKSTCKVTS